jgi:hypothetical protein
MKEIRCSGCGEWVPIPALRVERAGLVAVSVRYHCPICSQLIYEESPSFEDRFAEDLLVGKDWVRVNPDALAQFPRWGKADLDRSQLGEVEVICHRCKRWTRFDQLRSEYTTSPSVSWRRTYHCPHCGAQVGSGHGGDPSYNIAPADFPELVLEAVANGSGWARPVQENTGEKVE